MKRISLLLFCILLTACSTPEPDPPAGAITFKLAQPLGQKSVYSLSSSGRIEGGLAESEETDVTEIGMNATVEMEVVSVISNGNWTLTGRFKNVSMTLDGQSRPDDSRKLDGQNFAVTYDKDGKVANMTGMEGVEGSMNMKQMAAQMNPTTIFPDKPVSVGQTWPVEFTESSKTPGGVVTEITKGTGLLKEVSNGQATVEYDLNKEVSGAAANGTGKVRTTIVFDLEKARITSSQSEIRLEATVQTGMGIHAQTFTNQMKFELIDR